MARPKFRQVNTVLSNLKTAISGTYHAFKFAKYADRYLAEVPYRFNRRFDLGSILVRLVRAAALARPGPKSMIRLAELRAKQDDNSTMLTSWGESSLNRHVTCISHGL